MKKIVSALLLVAVCMMFILPIQGEESVPQRIRVGLIGNFSGLSSVNELPLKNTGLNIGVMGQDAFEVYDTYTSGTGFIIAKQDTDLIRFKKSFSDRKEAEQVQKQYKENNVLTTLGIDPSVGWYLYIMDVQKEEDAQNLLKEQGIEEEVKVEILKGKGFKLLDGSRSTLVVYSSSKDLPMQIASGDQEQIPVLKLNGSYRGILEIRRFSNSDLTVINELPLEQYLYGVVPNESPSGWNIEALKAQALAARSYAVFQIKLQRFKQFSFDVCRTISSQVYLGHGSEKPSTNKAVDETKGQVVLYNGKVADTMFFASSGGYTQDSKYLYSDVPYLKAVPEISSYVEPNVWKVTKTPKEIKDALAQRGTDIGDIIDMKVVEWNPSGRMQKIVIQGTKGSYELSGKSENNKPTIRSFFGLKDVMATIVKEGSTSANIRMITKGGNIQTTNEENLLVQTVTGRVAVSKKDMKVITPNGLDSLHTDSGGTVTAFTFVGKGNGHGIGMSQWGAQYMALAGYGYKDIIQHYYTGVTILE